MIEIKGFYKLYNSNYVLKNINLELPNKGLVIIEGESGSGKTTLLNMIGGLISPSDGLVKIDGVNIFNLKDFELDTFRIKNIGYVFQSFNLLQLESAEANIKMPLEAISSNSNQMMNQRVRDLLKELDISSLRKKTVNKLSGGEKQRVAIAKALVNNPKILLCDEPTGALDTINTKNIVEILKNASKTSLVIVVTHDLESFKDYADRIITIKDGSIVKDKKYKSKNKDITKHLVVSNSKYQKKPHLPLFFKIKHAIHKLSAKKWRFLISNFMLSLSLTGIGLSLIVSTSVGSKIQNAFSSLLNGNQIVVTQRHQSLNEFGSIFSASEDDVKVISLEYSDYIEGMGVTYLVNFEDFFKDGNNVWINDDTYSYLIPSLSARSFNDYRWIDDSFRQNISPELNREINKDEVVLALSYVDMINITFNLKIKRSFDSLANYIYHNNITLTLSVQNNSWQYSDEQIFRIVGVFEAEITYLTHTRKLWNQEIFEDEMRFPSSDGTTSKYPWEMYKLYYLATKEEPKAFLDETLKDDSLYDFVFERTSHDIHPLLCPIDGLCKSNRLLVYNADKNALRTGTLLNLISQYKDFKNYYFMSRGGYVSYGSMILDGFANTTFFSLSLEKNEASIDADTAKKDESLEIKLPKGVLKGNFMESMNGAVKFSSKIDSLVAGTLPLSNKEIVVSKAMANALDNGHDVLDSYLYVSTMLPKAIDESEKIYRTTRLKIVGINNSDKNLIYHNNDWTISFFRDEIGISNFSLCPNSLVIELNDNVDATKYITKLNKTFYDFNFSNPSEEIAKSINSTLDFIKLIVILFAVLAGTVSLLLLATLVLLNILENQHEVKIMKYSGISYRDINSQFVVDSMIQTFIAFLISMIELTIFDVVIGKVINEMMGASASFSLNPIPTIITFAIAMVSSFLISSFVVFIKTFSFKKLSTKKK